MIRQCRAADRRDACVEAGTGSRFVETGSGLRQRAAGAAFNPLQPSRRHSSALICASGDFFYYDRRQVEKYKEDKSTNFQSVAGSPSPSSKKGRLSQLFGKFGFDSNEKSPSKSVDGSRHRHSWTSAIFRGVRRKENKMSTVSKTSFSKIDEEPSTHDVATQQQQRRTSYTQSLSASKSRRRFKSKSERDLEGITSLCPVLGIRSIERGSQTESHSFGGAPSIWYQFFLTSRRIRVKIFNFTVFSFNL